MTSKRVVCVFSSSDVKISWVALNMPESPPKQPGETDDEYLLRIAQEDNPGATDYKICELVNLPDRRWRTAWHADQNCDVFVDLPGARQIRLKELGKIRDQKLGDVQKDFQEKFDQDQDLTQIKADRS